MDQTAPIPLRELPDGVRHALGRIREVSYPSQGATSAVAVMITASDRFVVKRSRGPQFPDWLEREHAVLRALQPLRLPVPRPVHFERTRPDEAWLVMEYLPGEPIGAVLARETDRTRRAQLLAQWGGRPPPATRRRAAARVAEDGRLAGPGAGRGGPECRPLSPRGGHF